jgi:hypothetical protein
MNEFEKIAEDIGKGVAYPFVHTAQFVKVLGDALTETPAVKTAVVQIVQAGEKIVADAGVDAVSKGLDLTSDLATVADVQSFFQLFATKFLPVVQAAYKELAADAKTAPAATSTATPSTSAATA